jgi:twitching motility protein PilT
MDACGASDLHLKAGCSPGLRVDGHLVPIDGVGPLSPQVVDRLVAAMTTQEQRGELLLSGDLEFAFTGSGASRYRVSLARNRGQTGAVLRRIPIDVPNFDELGLPAAAKKLCQLPRGIVLVAGPTGAGKSTTLAAMVDFVNRECAGHIMTVEDPIEFVHQDQACYVTQREVGVDCDSMELALRRALRHDPDVIVIDDLRNRETIALALMAAETGHLVLATVQTCGAVQTVDRLLDAFPLDQHAEMRGRRRCCPRSAAGASPRSRSWSRPSRSRTACATASRTRSTSRSSRAPSSGCRRRRRRSPSSSSMR